MKRVLGCLGVVAMFVGFAACGGARHVDAASLPAGEGWYCEGQGKKFTQCMRTEEACVAQATKDGLVNTKCGKWPFAFCVSWKSAGTPAYACTPNALECENFASWLREGQQSEDISICESHG